MIRFRPVVLALMVDVVDGFEFKWSDNLQTDGDIMDFYIHGDAAPSGRFNYVYQGQGKNFGTIAISHLWSTTGAS